MKYLYCTVLNVLIYLSSFGQYDSIIKSLIKTPQKCPRRLNGSFEKNMEMKQGANVEFYKFMKPNIDLCYYPKQQKIKCGYFKLYGSEIFLAGNLENISGCDLDYGSFEVYIFNLKSRKYLILNAVRYGSGTTVRYIYCNLFDISNKKHVKYYPLASIYGSGLSFGDYNNDCKIDFLEIGYKKNAKSPDEFTLIMKTLDNESSTFKTVPNKFISFVRRFKNDESFEIIKVDSNWY